MNSITGAVKDGLLTALKGLHFLLVLLGCIARVERSQVPSFACLLVFLLGIQPIFAGL